MIPLMEKEIVARHAWLARADFMDLLSMSQAMPGIFAANMASAVGYRMRGKWGAMVCVTGNVMMPVLFILLLAMFFRLFRGNQVIEHVFMGVRPCVVALIAAPVFNMARTAGIRWYNVWIPVVAALLIWLFDESPVLVIVAAGLLGFAWGRLHPSAQE